MNADAMRLHDGCGPIDIDDESGDVVALSMHEAIGVVGGIIDNADGASHVECRLQLAIPEGIVDLDIVERQHSDADAANLVVSESDKLPRCVNNPDNLTFSYVGGETGYCAGEDPWMETF